MDHADIIDYLNGHATEAEREAMEAWRDTSLDNRLEFQRVQRLWEASGTALQPEAPDVEAAWGKVHGRIQRPVRRLPAWGRIAAAVLLVLSGYWVWNAVRPAPYVEFRQGEQLATEALLLPDGSKVWLQKGTELRYPEVFDGKERLVRLSGEAYFEVARNEAQPFLIKTDAATVRVLGTSFGLMAYPDSSTAWVQVNSGKVAFYPNGAVNRQLVLEKGAGAVLDKASGQIQRLAPHASNRIAWQTKKLNFQNTSLREVALLLNDAYGVPVKLADPKLANCRFTASFDHEPLESVLQTLHILFGIEWERQGITIVLKGEGCKESIHDSPNEQLPKE